MDKGPIRLVEAGLLDQLKELNWNVLFDGHHQFEDINNLDDPPIGILKNPRLVSRVTESISRVVGGHAKKGQLPVTLGGDHSLVGLDFRRTQFCGLTAYSGHGHHLWHPEVRVLPRMWRSRFDGVSAYPDACVIWIDAHADINTIDTTESGGSHRLFLLVTVHTPL